MNFGNSGVAGIGSTKLDTSESATVDLRSYIRLSNMSFLDKL